MSDVEVTPELLDELERKAEAVRAERYGERVSAGSRIIPYAMTDAEAELSGVVNRDPELIKAIVAEVRLLREAVTIGDGWAAEQARREERRECARIARGHAEKLAEEGVYRAAWRACDRVANAIRARGENSGGGARMTRLSKAR